MTTLADLRLDLLRCPVTHEELQVESGGLVSVPSGHRYTVDANGIPLFGRGCMSSDARVQEAHYDRIAPAYLANLQYPHTEEYMAYFDRVLLEQVNGQIDTIVEVCCGAGEACWLLRDRVHTAVGIDVSTVMLATARARLPEARFNFVQGDACHLPLADGIADAVFMLGGVHHVNDRSALFSEVYRVLKSGGRFYFREPLDDFMLWRMARSAIYRLSPSLNAQTERPLRKRSTESALETAGLRLQTWRSLGFIGACVLMNSDVLIVNRVFRFVPAIRSITRFVTWFDEASLRVPGLQHAGVAVIGITSKA